MYHAALLNRVQVFMQTSVKGLFYGVMFFSWPKLQVHIARRYALYNLILFPFSEVKRINNIWFG